MMDTGLGDTRYLAQSYYVPRLIVKTCTPKCGSGSIYRPSAAKLLYRCQDSGPRSVESKEACIMKTAIVLFGCLAARLMAADPQTQSVKEPPARSEEVKRLGSVTWDLDSHKLVWIIQKGEMQNGEFVSHGEQRYEISPDDAMMGVSEELRGFDTDEAATLHQLLDVLSLYCAESVVWWEEGKGTPAPTSVRPKATQKPKTEKPADPESKPVKVKQAEPQQKRTYRVPDEH